MTQIIIVTEIMVMIAIECYLTDVLGKSMKSKTLPSSEFFHSPGLTTDDVIT